MEYRGDCEDDQCQYPRNIHRDGNKRKLFDYGNQNHYGKHRTTDSQYNKSVNRTILFTDINPADGDNECYKSVLPVEQR